MTRRALFFFLLLLIIPATARAANVVVPVAGRDAELVITNPASQAARVLITFYVAPNVRSFTTVNIGAYETLVSEVPAETKLIRVSGADVVARYGATPAIDIDALPTDAMVAGAVTIANPWNIAATITIGTQQRMVSPYEVLVLDDVAAARLTSQVGLYVLTSHVSPLPTFSDSISPPCAEPAPLGAAASTRFLVVRSDSADVAQLTPHQVASLRCDPAVEFIEPNVVE